MPHSPCNSPKMTIRFHNSHFDDISSLARPDPPGELKMHLLVLFCELCSENELTLQDYNSFWNGLRVDIPRNAI